MLAESAESEAEEKKQAAAEDDSDKEPVIDSLNAENPQHSAKKISATKLAVSALLIAAVFSGLFVFDNKSKPLEKKNGTLKKGQLTISDERKRPSKNQRENQSTGPTGLNGILDAKIREIGTLRNALLHKEEEILGLKEQYQKGIEEVENEIADQMQKEGIGTFLQAMENRRMAFGLQTIQRRQIYIHKLEKPLNWIFEACEEMLYIERLVRVDLQVAEIASGIDLNRHLRQMDTAAEKYRLTADKLAADLTDGQPESLEAIWERIDQRRLMNTAAPSHSKNQVISEQICSGAFERLAELTEISTETAECITRMQGSGLFLSSLTELTPAIARHLSQWSGSWLCLNGLRVLSPRAAHYLFQWEGKWISLNGLTEFPAEIGEALLQWKGAQLELMGLRSFEGFPGKIGIEYLAQWEKFGGKLFVPENIRKEIGAINREPSGAS